MMPIMASEWPTMYLVPAWIERSQAWSKGLKYSGEARLHGDRAMRALDGGDRVLQRLLRRRAVAAVAEAFERHAVLELLHGRGEDRRGVIDGWIDDAEVVGGIASGNGQNCVGFGI